MDAAGILFNLGPLGDDGEQVLFVLFADTPGNGAVVADSVPQFVAHHAVVVLFFILGGFQKFVNDLEGGFSVVIVGIDHRKGRIADGIPGAEHRMTGAPGLGAVDRNGISGREHIQFLVSIADLHRTFFQPLADGFHEILFNGFFDDDHGGIKTGFVGIVERKIQNGFAAGSHRIDLLQTAVAASHTGCHNHQNRLNGHKKQLLSYLYYNCIFCGLQWNWVKFTKILMLFSQMGGIQIDGIAF